MYRCTGRSRCTYSYSYGSFWQTFLSKSEPKIMSEATLPFLGVFHLDCSLLYEYIYTRSFIETITAVQKIVVHTLMAFN